MLLLALLATLTLTSASTLTPPVLPLVVRNPYLSTWLPNARHEPWNAWPIFYTGSSQGLAILASIPGTSTVYPLLGRPQDSLDTKAEGYNVSYPEYKGAVYDASTTNLSYVIPSGNSEDDAGVEVVVSFLSPITPTSTLRQSIPASYLSVHVKGSADVDIYIDINGQWVSGNRGSEIEWSLTQPQPKSTSQSTKPSLKTWQIKRRQDLLFTEEHDQAEWGTLHFTGPSDIAHEAGTSGLLRQRFARNSTLHNTIDSEFRGIMDEEPVFAFSKHFNLSSNTSTTKEDSVLFTLTHVQNPVVQFASERGLTYMRPLWESYFPTVEELIAYHYSDFPHAVHLAANYSAQLTKDAGDANYADLTSLAARQVMGATSFSGTPSNPLLFLKEISSNGNSQTVDVIFPAFPFFLYTNPRWLAYLLEPLLEHMLSGQYPNDYTMHDLGTHFPNLTGHADGRDEYMPVEECGDMLVMGLALVNSLSYEDEGVGAGSVWSAEGVEKDVGEIMGMGEGEEGGVGSVFGLPAELETRDGVWGLDDRWGGQVAGKVQAKVWLERSYKLWRQWTGYLVEYSLEPHNQLCTDDFAGWLALQTNLALKGIVGIKAMSELASVVGDKEGEGYWRNVSSVYVEKWEGLGMSRDFLDGRENGGLGGRAKLAYDWEGSWTTLYSLFADAILCFHPEGGNSSSSSADESAPPAQEGQQQPLTPSGKKESSKNFIPNHIYTTQSLWYSTAMQKYGLPLDSRHLYTKSDWEFQAAAVASPELRRDILERSARWVNETGTDRPLTDLYQTEGKGGFPGPDFFARPVVGSFFSGLALGRACGGRGDDAFR
ncbi:hypothetical protein LTR17_012160 [Elasticomyces elasticus]|nr:hypothetical protein LTR17_012160 [Elasticomyces elasticus]